MTNSTAATAAADQDKTQHALHHLLQNSRHLTNQQYTKATVHPDTLLPLDLKLERPLEQLEQQSRKLWHRLAVLRNTASGGTAMDASAVGDGRAHYLLAGKGFDAERVLQTLNTIQMQQAFEPMQPLQDTDVDGYLRNEHELLIVGVIEEERRQALQEFQSQFEQRMQADWERAKKHIFESLGQQQLLASGNMTTATSTTTGRPWTSTATPGRSSTTASTTTATAMGRPPLFPSTAGTASTTTAPPMMTPVRPLLSTPASAGGMRQQGDASFMMMDGVTGLEKRMVAYAQAVGQLNETRLQNRPVHVTRLFQQASREAVQDGKDDQLSKSWELLSFVVGESSMATTVRAGGAPSGSSLLGTPSAPATNNRLYPSLSQTGAHTEKSTPGLYHERDLAKPYHSPYDSVPAQELRQQFAQGGRKWLELFFRRYLDDMLDRQQQGGVGSATPGGPSSFHKFPILQKVQAFTKQVQAFSHSGEGSWEMVDGYPFWATLFYLVRCGALNDALEYAMRYEKYLAKTERRFLDYFSAWISSPGHQMPRKLRLELLNEFNVRIRDGVLRGSASVSHHGPGSQHGLGSSGMFHRSLTSAMGSASVDPYKYLLFRVMGRIGLDDTAIPHAVIKSLAGGILGWEDDLWFQLMLVRETIDSDMNVPGSPSMSSNTSSTAMSLDPSLQNERFTLKDLYERYVLSFPIDTWTGNGAYPIRYFQILLLCGEFERAIQYLWNCGKTEFHQTVGSRPLQGARWYSEVDALHFAIALVFYGVLRVPPEVYSMEMDIGSLVEEPCRSRNGVVQHVQIHFARMLQVYTKSLFVRVAHPQQASQYYFLLCLLDQTTDDMVMESTHGADEMKQLCYDWIIDLILELGLIDEFLGTIGFGSTSLETAEIRTPGFLDKYLPLIKLYSWDDFKTRIIRPAAERAERRATLASQTAELESSDASMSIGSKRDGTAASISATGEVELQQSNAVLLYNLAEEYDTVLDMLSKRVSTSLRQRNLEVIVDSVIELVQTGRIQNVNVSRLYSLYDIDQLSRTESTAASVLDYYISRPHILTRISSERRKTLSTLINVIQFYKCCIQVAREVVVDRMEPPQMQVQQQEVGVSLKLSSGKHGSDWSAGLMLIEDIGLVPLGFSRPQQPSKFHESPRFGRSPAMTPVRGSGTPTAGTPSGQHHQTLISSDVDYTRVMTKAEQLRREFSDLVLNHLPDILLSTEMLILLAWHAIRSKKQQPMGISDESAGIKSWSRKSRQLQSYVSAISRWYKIPAEIRRRLITMDEIMMIQ